MSAYSKLILFLCQVGISHSLRADSFGISSAVFSNSEVGQALSRLAHGDARGIAAPAEMSIQRPIGVQYANEHEMLMDVHDGGNNMFRFAQKEMLYDEAARYFETLDK